MSVHNDYDVLQDALAELDELKASPLADAIGPLVRIIDGIDGARRAGWAKYYAEREAHEDTERRLAAQTMTAKKWEHYFDLLKAELDADHYDPQTFYRWVATLYRTRLSHFTVRRRLENELEQAELMVERLRGHHAG